MKPLLRYELFYFTKTSRLIVLGAVAFILSALAALSARYMHEILAYVFRQEGIEPPPMDPVTVADAYVEFFSQYAQIYVLVLLFIAVGAFTHDRTKNHYPFIFSHGTRKNHYVSAKFIMIVAAMLVSLAVGVLSFFFYAQVLFGTFDFLRFFGGVALFVLFMIFLIVFAGLVTFATGSYVIGLVVSIGAYILMTSITFVDFGVFGYLPNQLINQANLFVVGDGEPRVLFMTSLISVVVTVLLYLATLKVFSRKPLS